MQYSGESDWGEKCEAASTECLGELAVSAWGQLKSLGPPLLGLKGAWLRRSIGAAVAPVVVVAVGAVVAAIPIFGLGHF